MRRRRFAQRQRVELVADVARAESAEQQRGGRHPHQAPLRSGQRAQAPEAERAQLFVGGEVSAQAHHRHRHRIECQAGEQQARHRPRRQPARHAVEREAHAQRAAEGRRRQHEDAPGRWHRQLRGGEHREHQRHCAGSATGHAQQARVGQRVAEQALCQCSGQAERSAHAHRHQRPRQAQVPQDVGAAAHRLGGVEQGPPIACRDRHGAEQYRQSQCHEQGRAQSPGRGRRAERDLRQHGGSMQSLQRHGLKPAWCEWLRRVPRRLAAGAGRSRSTKVLRARRRGGRGRLASAPGLAPSAARRCPRPQPGPGRC